MQTWQLADSNYQRTNLPIPIIGKTADNDYWPIIGASLLHGKLLQPIGSLIHLHWQQSTANSADISYSEAFNLPFISHTALSHNSSHHFWLHFQITANIVGISIARSTRHTAGHFRDESFQAISCTGTDNQAITKRKCAKHKREGNLLYMNDFLHHTLTAVSERLSYLPT